MTFVKENAETLLAILGGIITVSSLATQLARLQGEHEAMNKEKGC